MLREVYTVDPAWEKPVDRGLEQRFERIKAKLVGFVAVLLPLGVWALARGIEISQRRGTIIEY